ncbi:hypothetical protein BC829DRAFT_416722 [Chytridium lagenaria]|nr:hypothetical protein BC829DRAFT_416722 [Chytridium lagenaria]
MVRKLNLMQQKLNSNRSRAPPTSQGHSRTPLQPSKSHRIRNKAREQGDCIFMERGVGACETNHGRSSEKGGRDEEVEYSEMDQILEDIIPMFFQYWSSNGRCSEHMYPVYVKLAKMKHTLDHLNESGLYTEHVVADIETNSKTLKTRFSISRFPRKVKKEATSPVLPCYNPRFQMLQDELREIDSVRIDGSYLGMDGSVLPGQAAVIALIESAYDDVHELLSMREAIDGDNPLRGVYEKLIRIKGTLEKIQIVHRWTLKPEDLVKLQMELGAIDNLRVDGKFLDEKGQCPEGQAVLHFLLHKCYRLVYKLQTSSEETVADSLIPVRNQLMTSRNVFKSSNAGKSNSRTALMVNTSTLTELYPRAKVSSTPPNECYEILRALQHAAQELEDEDDFDYGDDDDFEEEEVEDEEIECAFPVHELEVGLAATQL